MMGYSGFMIGWGTAVFHEPRVPPPDTVSTVVAALRARGMSPALGGSGLLVALGPVDVAHDRDVTVDADPSAVPDALEAARCAVRDDTSTTGVHATGRRLVVAAGDHDVDVLVPFALRGPGGVEALPVRVTGT